MRLFVAVYPSPEALDHIEVFSNGLDISRAAAGVNMRRTARSLQHVTVAFLGECEPQPALTAVSEAAAVCRPVVARLAGGGSFGHGRLRVLWVGVQGALEGLATAVRRALVRHGVPFDRRPFRPHLTLARPAGRIDITNDEASLRSYRGPEWYIDKIHLVCSHVGTTPTHETLASLPLSASVDA